MRDAALVDRHDVVRPVLHAARPARSSDTAYGDPGAPVETRGVPGHLLDDHVDVELGEPGQLLAHDRRLELAAARRSDDVLPVAAAAAARARPTGTAARRGPSTASTTSTASARQ